MPLQEPPDPPEGPEDRVSPLLAAPLRLPREALDLRPASLDLPLHDVGAVRRPAVDRAPLEALHGPALPLEDPVPLRVALAVRALVVRRAVRLHRQADVGEGEVHVVPLDAQLRDGGEALLRHRLVQGVLDRGHPDGAPRGLDADGAGAGGGLRLDPAVDALVAGVPFDLAEDPVGDRTADVRPTPPPRGMAASA